MSRPPTEPPPRPGTGASGAPSPGDQVPPASQRPPSWSQSPPGHDRSTLERILPELLRRGLLAGKDTLESVMPGDVASNLVGQLVDVRQGVVKAVAQEVGRFLREADIASEMRKVLAGMDVEVKFRFTEREDGSLSMSLSEADTKRSRGRKGKKAGDGGRGGSEPPGKNTDGD